MAQRTAYLHIGPTHAGTEFLDDALAAYADELGAQGVRRPARSADEMVRAAVEIRRDHKAWGLKRKDVEGVWSSIARRAWKGRDTVVFTQPHLAGATREEIALLLDALPGFDVHVVVNATPPGAPGTAGDEGLTPLATRWAAALRSPDRLHVIVAPPGGTAAAHTWRSFGRIVGFETGPLPVVPPLEVTATAPATRARHDQLVELAEGWAKAIADGGYDVHGDLTDLVPVSTEPDDDAVADAVARRLATTAEELARTQDELARLRVAHAALEARHASGKSKRKKLERRLTDAQG